MNAPADLDLYERYRKNPDAEGMARLVAGYEQRIYNLALSVLRNPARAEDATQEVFLKLIQARALPEPVQFKAWLYRVAMNQALQLRREEARRAAREIRASRPEEGDHAMDEAVSQTELLERVQREIESLEPDLQQALVLRYQHDLSFEEVAHVLEKPQGTVSRHVFEARERLRKRLAPALSALVPIETLVQQVPHQPVPAGLHAKLQELARGSGTTFAPHSPAKLKPAIVATLLILPAIVLVWSVAMPGRIAEPEKISKRAAGSTETKSGASPDEPSAAPENPARRSSLFGPAGETPGKIRALEVKFRVALTDGLSGRAFPKEGILLSSKLVIPLESEIEGPAEENVSAEGPGVFMITRRCTARGLFDVTAGGAGQHATAYAIAGPGDVVDLRLAFNLEQTSQGPRPQELLLREMAEFRRFGAIRVRVSGYDSPPTLRMDGPKSSGKKGGSTVLPESGSHLVIPVEPGARHLLVTDTCCTQSTPVEVRAGELTDLGTLAHLPKAGLELGGTVHDADGRPVEGAMVLLLTDDENIRTRTTKTDAAGRFLLKRLNPDEKGLQLSVFPARSVGVQSVPVTAGSLDIQIRLPRTLELRLRATSDEGAGLPASFGVSEFDGKLPPGTHTPSDGSNAPDGSFRLVLNADLYPAGSRVKIRAWCPGYDSPLTDWIVVQDGLELNLVLKKEHVK